VDKLDETVAEVDHPGGGDGRIWHDDPGHRDLGMPRIAGICASLVLERAACG